MWRMTTCVRMHAGRNCHGLSSAPPHGHSFRLDRSQVRQSSHGNSAFEPRHNTNKIACMLRGAHVIMHEWNELPLRIQVVASIAVTASTAVAALASTAVTFTTPALTGLVPSTAYAYSVARGDSTNAVNCASLGTSDSTGSIGTKTMPTAGLTYATATATAYTTILTVYTSATCSAAPTASSVAVSSGTVSVLVGSPRGKGGVLWLRSSIKASVAVPHMHMFLLPESQHACTHPTEAGVWCHCLWCHCVAHLLHSCRPLGEVPTETAFDCLLLRLPRSPYAFTHN